MMNPQILIDAVQHGLKGMILLFDNRRMGAITSLQNAQYSIEYKTDDQVVVDYVQMAEAVQGVKGFYSGETPEEMKEAIRIINGRAETECSGNVTRENIRQVTEVGVDYISSGALTHSAPILDISMKNLHPVEE